MAQEGTEAVGFVDNLLPMVWPALFLLALLIVGYGGNRMLDTIDNMAAENGQSVRTDEARLLFVEAIGAAREAIATQANDALDQYQQRAMQTTTPYDDLAAHVAEIVVAQLGMAADDLGLSPNQANKALDMAGKFAAEEDADGNLWMVMPDGTRTLARPAGGDGGDTDRN